MQIRKEGDNLVGIPNYANWYNPNQKEMRFKK